MLRNSNTHEGLTHESTKLYAHQEHWTGTLLSNHVARSKLEWDVSASRVFISHALNCLVTDEDPRCRNVSLQYTPCYVIAQHRLCSVERRSMSLYHITKSSSGLICKSLNLPIWCMWSTLVQHYVQAVIVNTSDEIDFKGEVNEAKHQCKYVMGDKS